MISLRNQRVLAIESGKNIGFSYEFGKSYEFESQSGISLTKCVDPLKDMSFQSLPYNMFIYMYLLAQTESIES